MDTWFIGLISFAFATSVTPGPNNVLVTANAASHGVRGTIPQMLGIASGFATMIVLVGLGVAGVLATVPILATAMRWAAFAWLLWMAWGIANAGTPGGLPGNKPFGFWSAVAFQWINPKAWLIALTIASAWVRPGSPALPQLLLIGTVFFAVGPPSNLPWALMGAGAARFLDNPTRLRWFNRTMAVLLVASMLPAVIG